ncbi:MAG: low specificity L-threonine aldolase [Oscillospiraceae bacterium]|nr:low specificity L-threonine aldolase [Oscillospiraceae bacterium]
MNKLSFASDYQEGAHSAIIERLCETNLQKSAGYGLDENTADAREKIRAACSCPDAAVHFLVGGTQTNATVIDALLRSYQGVIAAESGHISVHEAGAIEYGGHKVLSLPHKLGKLDAAEIREYCETYWHDGNREHMVMPGMVYLSQPTEYGTLYSLAELTAIRAVCDDYHMALYVDGARLAYALACEENDVTLPDLARLCDVFYIGGTKCGALFGEAVVIPDPTLLPHFFTIVKQHGALLAKGRLLGLQFDTLFTDGLYMEIGKPALRAADTLRFAFQKAGYRLAFDSPTNQVFVVLTNDEMERLSESVEFSFWEKYDEAHTVVRLAASWATRLEDAERLAGILGEKETMNQ